LEELDFADDLALLSHIINRCRDNIELRGTMSTHLGLNRSKTKIMKANTKNNNPIILKGEPLEMTDSLTQLGSTNKKEAQKMMSMQDYKKG